MKRAGAYGLITTLCGLTCQAIQVEGATGLASIAVMVFGFAAALCMFALKEKP